MTFHKHIQLLGPVTVGPKGQVVIPVEVREGMGITPGDKLIALYFDEKSQSRSLLKSRRRNTSKKWAISSHR